MLSLLAFENMTQSKLQEWFSLSFPVVLLPWFKLFVQCSIVIIQLLLPKLNKLSLQAKSIFSRKTHQILLTCQLQVHHPHQVSTEFSDSCATLRFNSLPLLGPRDSSSGRVQAFPCARTYIRNLSRHLGTLCRRDASQAVWQFCAVSFSQLKKKKKSTKSGGITQVQRPKESPGSK